MATIRNIAQQLGVSLSTVSAVLNNRGYVSPKMRAYVQKALRDTNYQPNQLARSLRMRETRTIGLIVPDLSNSFYAHLMRGAEDYLAVCGYRLVVADSREDWKRQHDYLTSFCGKMADGIILVPCMATDEQISMLPRIVREIPLVYVDRSPLKAHVDSVLVDNVKASSDATRYLLELGHRRIAIITEPLNLLNAAERLVGYKQALASFHAPLERELIRTGDNTEDSGHWKGLELLTLRNRPTAVLVCNNLMTLGMLTAVWELGLSCPREISMVGFDDLEWSVFTNPPLTMVRLPASEMGAAAAKAVLKRLWSPEAGKINKVLLPTQLIVRGSSVAACRARRKRK